jgi:hypothetical protein
MRSVRTTTLSALATTALLAGLALVPVAAQTDDEAADVVTDWNVNALGAISASGAAPTLGSALMGMVHGAIYDAVVSIAGGYEPYLGEVEADPDASKMAAAASAAHGVLDGLFPDQSADLQALLDASLAEVSDGLAKDAGIAVGEAAAAAMLAAREGDGRGEPNPLTWDDGPGDHRPTPPSFAEYVDAGIANVRTFLADDATYYRTAGPLALDSPEYAAELEEVRTKGAAEGSTRTAEDEELMVFWFGPAPQWSMAQRWLTSEHDLGITEAARLFAMSNLAAADAAIACQADKYHYRFWRPITAIQEADDDGNDATVGDPQWTPINGVTPPYPEHPSGWNCNAGAHGGAVREFFGTDDIAYEIMSPDFPEPRQYTSISQGLQEGIELRILEGIHFRNGDEQGVEAGLKAAALAAERLAPVSTD